MSYPLKGQYARITNPYGRPDASLTCGVHTGADLAAPEGTPIYAPCDGTIRHRSYGSALGSHQFAISPSSGQAFAAGEIFFAHTATRPADGSVVTLGQQIAEVGAEGNVTGPHLHLEYHPNSKGSWNCSVHANPQPVLDHGGGPSGSPGSPGYSGGAVDTGGGSGSYAWAVRVRTPSGGLETLSIAQLPDNFGGKYDRGVAVIGGNGSQTGVYIHTNPAGNVIGGLKATKFRKVNNSTSDATYGRLAAQRQGKLAYALFNGVGGARVLRFTASSSKWVRVNDHEVVMSGGMFVTPSGSAFVTDHSSHPQLWVQNSFGVTSFQDTVAGRASPKSQSFDSLLDDDVLGCRLAPPLNRTGPPELWWFIKRARGTGIDVRIYRAEWRGSGFDTTWRSNLVGVIKGLTQISNAPSVHADRRLNGVMEVSLVGIRPRNTSKAAGATYALTINGGFQLTGLLEKSPQMACPGIASMMVDPEFLGSYTQYLPPQPWPQPLLEFEGAFLYHTISHADGMPTFSSLRFGGQIVMPPEDRFVSSRVDVVGLGYTISVLWASHGGWMPSVGISAGWSTMMWHNFIDDGDSPYGPAYGSGRWRAGTEGLPLMYYPPGQIQTENADGMYAVLPSESPGNPSFYFSNTSSPTYSHLSIPDTWTWNPMTTLQHDGPLEGWIKMSCAPYREVNVRYWSPVGGTPTFSEASYPWVSYGSRLRGITNTSGWLLNLVLTAGSFGTLRIYQQSPDGEDEFTRGGTDGPSHGPEAFTIYSDDLPFQTLRSFPVPDEVMSRFRSGSHTAFSFTGGTTCSIGGWGLSYGG